MKKSYEAPEWELVRIQQLVDVLSASRIGEGGGQTGDPGDEGGGGFGGEDF